ncbi:hypothetical protein [Olleya sp. Bg11-27]|uniref:hypothetical protein n=1 Tax=Olleya sp. Bg11-27 TaxID=2058135 RepID=UPI000C309A8E|nr:hypothetical protein [Olleya sp. Bg11-27]AUC75801.1 hypothetical protein CW732_08965 [Olleya sp. Bg11-27]
MDKYYSPSGKFDSKAILYFILISVIALPLLGLAYSYAIWYIPIIYLNFLIAGAVGFAIAWLISKFVITMGKVRNKTLAIIFALLASVITLYSSWVVWADLVINIGESYGNSRIGITASNVDVNQLYILATNPLTLFELIANINEYGTWGIKSATVSGTFLTIIWIIEAVLIIGVTLLLTNGSTVPFCELSNQWFNSKNLPAFGAIDNRPALIKAIENGDPTVFNTLTLVTKADQDHSVFTLYSSSNNENYLTINNKKAKYNKDGELEFEDTLLVENIYINNELKDKLINFKDIIQPTLDSDETLDQTQILTE